MPYVEASINIKGDIEKIWAIVSDMEQYPKFMRSVKSVEILERSTNETISKWTTDVDGRVIIWTEKDTFFPVEHRIEYIQVSGDLKKFQGMWQLSNQPENVNVLLTVD
ncbi:MAG: SRPBCC family protein, partial [bacterium]|nr:SRPBCC family protein [bacterium]